MWENSVLSRFRDTLYKVRRKWEKSAFFARRYAKSVRKQCSFTFFKTLCTKFAENKQNQRILSFFCDVPQKVWVNSVFSRLLRHFVQSSQKMRKTAFLSFFCVVPRKVWENCVFSLFHATFCKKCEKNSVFSRFSKHFVQSSQKMQKQRFLSFLRDVPQKVWENSVFFTFFETLCTKFAKKV